MTDIREEEILFEGFDVAHIVGFLTAHGWHHIEPGSFRVINSRYTERMDLPGERVVRHSGVWTAFRAVEASSRCVLTGPFHSLVMLRVELPDNDDFIVDDDDEVLS